MVMVAIPGRALSGTHPVNGYNFSLLVILFTVPTIIRADFQHSRSSKRLTVDIRHTGFGKTN
jgi:hypothetical protein